MEAGRSRTNLSFALHGTFLHEGRHEKLCEAIQRLHGSGAGEGCVCVRAEIGGCWGLAEIVGVDVKGKDRGLALGVGV